MNDRVRPQAADLLTEESCPSNQSLGAKADLTDCLSLFVVIFAAEEGVEVLGHILILIAAIEYVIGRYSQRR